MIAQGGYSNEPIRTDGRYEVRRVRTIMPQGPTESNSRLLRPMLSQAVQEAWKALEVDALRFGGRYWNDPTYRARMQERARNMRYLRPFIRRRDKRTCRRCGCFGVEVHHIIPIKNGGVDTPENLVLLCKGCHRAVHRKDSLPSL